MGTKKETTTVNLRNALNEVYSATKGGFTKLYLTAILNRNHVGSTDTYHVIISELLEPHPALAFTYRWKGQPPTETELQLVLSKAAKRRKEARLGLVEAAPHLPLEYRAPKAEKKPRVFSGPRPGILIRIYNYFFYNPARRTA